MAFNFAGTFTTGQWEAFKVFTQIQVYDLKLRKKWLEVQLERTGGFATTYNGSAPSKFTVPPSYASKLIEAYKIFGGVPERDMLLRDRDNTVFLVRSSTSEIGADGRPVGGDSDTYSNGRRFRGNQRFDKFLALKVERLKQWQLSSIKSKRERLEYKIKAALDYSDQLEQEIKLIDSMLVQLERSVENQIIEIEATMERPNSANVVRNLEDQFGLAIGQVADSAFDDRDQVAAEGDQRGT